MKRRSRYKAFFAALLVSAVAGAAFAQDDVKRENRPGYIAGQRGRMMMHRAVPVGPGDHATFEFMSAGYQFAGEVVKDAPYSAEAVTETVQTLSDGNRIVRRNTTKLYRDDQGRTRREQTLATLGPWAAAGEPQVIIFINDPVDNVQYVLNPNERTARKMTPPRFEQAATMETIEGNFTAPEPGEGHTVDVRRFAWFDREGDTVHETHDVTIAAPPFAQQHMAQSPVTESLGERVVEGVQARGVKTTMTIPEGMIGNERPIQIVSERWTSPELGVLVESKRTDPRVGETSYRLSNIQRIEPLASLFAVPPDYTLEEGHPFAVRRFNEQIGSPTQAPQ